MDSLVKTLLYLTRGGLFLVLLIPHLTAQDSFMPQMWYPDVTVRNFFFRYLVEALFVMWAVLACLDQRYRPKLRGSLLAMCCFVAVIAVAGLSAFYVLPRTEDPV